MKSQFQNILKNRGLEQIKVKEGEEKFNPQFQEAVAEEESDKEPQTILEVIEDGFTLHGKVVRATKVKIAR